MSFPSLGTPSTDVAPLRGRGAAEPRSFAVSVRIQVEMAAPFDAKVAQCGITCGCALTCVALALKCFVLADDFCMFVWQVGVADGMALF